MPQPNAMPGQPTDQYFAVFRSLPAPAVILTAKEARILEANDRACELLGYTRDELMQLTWAGIAHPEDAEIDQANFNRLLAGEIEHYSIEKRFLHKSGRVVQARISMGALHGPGGELQGVLGLLDDITEQKETEQLLHENEQRLHAIFDGVKDAVFVESLDGHILDVNQSACLMFGYSREQFLSKTVDDLVPSTDWKVRVDASGPTSPMRAVETVNVRANGEQFPIEISIRRARMSGEDVLFVVGRDITERKQVEVALRASEEKYRRIVETAKEGMVAFDADLRVSFANARLAEIFEYPLDELTGKSVYDFIFESDLVGFESRLARLKEGAATTYQGAFRTKSARPVWVQTSATPAMQGGKFDGVFLMVTDITERKRAEDERHALAEVMQAAALTDSLQEFLGRVRQSLGSVLDARNLFVVFHNNETGMFEEVFAVDEYDEPMPPARLEKSITSYVFRTGAPLLLTQTGFDDLQARGEVELVGSHSASWLGAPLKAPNGPIGVIAVQNYEDPNCYSERDQAFLASVAGEVALAIERKRAADAIRLSEARYHNLVESQSEVIARSDLSGKLTFVNDAYCHTFGKTRQELLGRSFAPTVQPEDLPITLAALEAVRQPPYRKRTETRNLTTEGVRWFGWENSAVRDEAGNVIELQGVGRDITRVKQDQEKLQRQLDNLRALREIDEAIASSFGLEVSLGTIISRATTELGVDAARVLLLDPVSNALTPAVGRGFRTETFRRESLRLGSAYAGQAVLERRTVQITNIGRQTETAPLVAGLAGEGFVSYFGVPLITKGIVHGVLEVFHRSRLEPDEDWHNFLQALAGQAAIAIDNAVLFQKLEFSNRELAIAYEATIEGWSQAMDLRDKETEGHTRRVTDMTVELARAFGMSEEEIVHIRRGALLHDIGKMGIPDHILLKSGPLTDEEWAGMRQHPDFAYKMLSPIRYLQRALNIPYCHHEKWNGSGYPRGLQGEQIPLEARIFAVVDVWDALTSDRPYRPAWPVDKALEHIQSQAGTHFDPDVVRKFLTAGIV